jgi:hypothetical protein
VNKSRLWATSLFVVAALTLAGCASGGTTTPAATQPETPTPEPKVFVTAPLTGVTYEEGAAEAATFGYPAVSCKIDNAYAARPQYNLNKADLTFVELVEGGVTRIVGIWQSQPVNEVGPVRSIRPMDPDIISPLGGIVCYSGGQQVFINMMKDTGLYNATETTEQSKKKNSFSRSSLKPAPHNVIVDMALLQSQHLDLLPPQPMFDIAPFDPEAETYAAASAAAGETVLDFTVSYPGATSFWKAGKDGLWLRSQDNEKATDAATNEQLKAVNVVVMKVRIDTASFPDKRYGSVPKTVMIATGTAWVFNNGKLIKGTWSKAETTSPIQLIDELGQKIVLAPGNTWIELMPTYSSIEISRPVVASPSPSATPANE